MGEAVVVVRTEVDGSAVQFLLALEGAAVQATDQQRNPALDGVEPSSCRIASAFAKVRNGSPNQCSCYERRSRSPAYIQSPASHQPHPEANLTFLLPIPLRRLSSHRKHRREPRRLDIYEFRLFRLRAVDRPDDVFV